MSTDILQPHIAAHAADEPHHDAGGLVVFGFWIYLMSDLVLFACLFATYSVLLPNIADGPSSKQIFELPLVLVETFTLLFSSLTFGLSMLALHKNRRQQVLGWLLLTFLLGLTFISIELYEFNQLISAGYGPNRSAFLSAFFALVGTHGLHVTAGLIWMMVLISQLLLKGINNRMGTRMMCLSLFWHFLDIIWICVFTIVYLLGAM